MNLKRSIRVALAQRDKNQAWLSEQSGISESHISVMCKNGTASLKTIQVLANALGMTTSEFIALGENE